MTGFYFRTNNLRFHDPRDFLFNEPVQECVEDPEVKKREEAQRAAVQTKRHKKPVYVKPAQPDVPYRLAQLFQGKNKR